MKVNYAAERARAAWRTGLVAALVGAWSAYAGVIPIESATAALKAALVMKAPPRRSSASVSWMNGGAPLSTSPIVSGNTRP